MPSFDISYSNYDLLFTILLNSLNPLGIFLQITCLILEIKNPKKVIHMWPGCCRQQEIEGVVCWGSPPNTIIKIDNHRKKLGFVLSSTPMQVVRHLSWLSEFIANFRVSYRFKEQLFFWVEKKCLLLFLFCSSFLFLYLDLIVIIIIFASERNDNKTENSKRKRYKQTEQEQTVQQLSSVVCYLSPQDIRKRLSTVDDANVEKGNEG